MAGDCMMKFCPMCGEKIPSETSKFCMGCGLNLVAYRKKLEHLSASEPLDKNNSSRETKTASGKSVPPRPRVDEPQDMTRSLFERFGYLPHLYFNVSGEKNSMKVNSAVKAYAHDAANENIIFVLDDTLFGGGEDGFLVTTENIYVHNMGEKAFVVSWHEVQTFAPTVKKLNQRIAINGGREICLSGYSQGELNTLVELLDAIKANRGGQMSVTPKKTSPPRQETRQDVEPAKEFVYYTPPPPFTPPPPKNDFGRPYVRSAAECRTKDQKHAAEWFTEAIDSLNSPNVDLPIIRNSALRQIRDAAREGYIPAIYLLAHIYFDGYMTEKDWINAKRLFEAVAVYGDDDGDDVPQRLIALGRFSTIIRHNPGFRIDILKPKVFHYYLRERLEKSFAENHQLKCVYFNTAHCDRKTLKKVNSALEVYVGQLKEFEFPLIVFDPTTVGSANVGCLFSNFGIYVRNDGEQHTHFIDYESYETDDITIRGLILKDIYVEEQKIETSGCGYNNSERTVFSRIVRDMGNIFGKR